MLKINVASPVSRILAPACLFLLGSACQAGADEIYGELAEFIRQKQLEREKLYDNMVGEWQEESIIGGTQARRNLVRFWSRNGEFFRIDITTQEPGDEQKPPIRRVIVWPEGYVRARAWNDDDLGAIFESGSRDEGMRLVVGDRWFCQSNKHTLSPTYKVIDRSNDPKMSMGLSVEVKDDVIEMYADVERPDHHASGVTVLSRSEAKVIKGNSRVEFDNGDWIETTIAKSYDQGERVPSSSTEVRRDSDGYTEQWNYSLQNISFERAEDSVFLMDQISPAFASGGTKGSVWFLVVNTILVIVLGLVWLSKRNKPKKPSAEQ